MSLCGLKPVIHHVWDEDIWYHDLNLFIFAVVNKDGSNKNKYVMDYKIIYNYALDRHLVLLSFVATNDELVRRYCNL